MLALRIPLAAASVAAAVAVAAPMVLAAMASSAGAQASPAPPPFSPATRAGNLVYLSGVLPTGDGGTIVSGDIRAQTRRTLDNLAAAALKNGTALERAAAVNVYLKRAEDFSAMNEVYRTYWPKDPPARTTVVADLVVPEALIEISMVAIVTGAPRQVVQPASWVSAANPYSYGVLAGDTLFTSGLLSRSGVDNSPIPGDITAQTKAVLENARAVLAAGGMTPSDVVAARVYLTSAADFQAMNAAYRGFFAKDPPSRATVQVGLTAPPYLVEIALVAVKDADRQVVTPANSDGTPGRPNPNLSAAIRVGDRLFLSGMLGANEATRGQVAGQTREALARLGRTLSAAGFAWSDVVESTVWLPDLAGFKEMNEVYRSVLTPPFPARATVRSGLMGADGLVEIAMTAVRRR